MADIGGGQNWLVSPTREVDIKWIDVQIQERISRIVRHRQDIEDLVKGQIVSLEAKIIMLDKEVKELEVRKQRLQPIDVEVIHESDN
jgi:hypothetical protein